jgi:hypothetical protein
MGKLLSRILFFGVLCALPAMALADGLDGSYDATGINALDGTSYSGTVTITRSGDVYEVTWKVGDSSYIGTGVRVDDVLSVGYTDETKSWFGVVGYHIGKGGRLLGTWCTLLGKTVGTETLVRRKPR